MEIGVLVGPVWILVYLLDLCRHLMDVNGICWICVEIRVFVLTCLRISVFVGPVWKLEYLVHLFGY